MAAKKKASVPECALVIKAPFINQILAGTKTWELRNRRTTKRGRIGLIQSGTGMVVGEANLVDVLGPLSLGDYMKNARRWAGQPSEVELSWRGGYAWVLKNARRYRNPVPYKHPQGAIIWVKLR